MIIRVQIRALFLQLEKIYTPFTEKKIIEGPHQPSFELNYCSDVT